MFVSKRITIFSLFIFIVLALIFSTFFVLERNTLAQECIPLDSYGCTQTSECCSGDCYLSGSHTIGYCCQSNSGCSCQEADKNGDGVVNILDLVRCGTADECYPEGCSCYPCLSCVVAHFNQTCCKPDGTTCSLPNECCSALCSGGYCASCRVNGDSCSLPNQCCSGLCSGGYCVSCKNNGDFCSLSTECCSGLCWFSQCMACKPLLSSCSASSECCSGTTCCNNGCRLPDGSTGCTQNGDCCSNRCLSGTCQPCLSQGQTICYSDSDCCSGLVCTSGTCQTSPPLPSLTLTVSKSGLGTVTSNPTGIDCGSDCSQSYQQNTSVTLTANPEVGFTFAGWSGGGCSGTGNCIVLMTSDITVTATFNSPMPPALGYVRVQATGRMVELRVISVDDAKNQNNGVVKIAMPGGMIGAADLVLTTDSNASPVRIMTTRGIRSWRKK